MRTESPEPFDEDYIRAWSFERQVAAYNRDHGFGGGDQCRRCGHAWHGLTCTRGNSGCLCPTAFEVAS